MKAGLCLANADGHIVDVDHRFCDLLGCDRAVFVGRHPLELTHHEDRHRNAVALERLTLTDQPFVIRKRYVFPDGRAQWVENCVRVLRDGAVLRLLAEMRPQAPIEPPADDLYRADSIFSALERLSDASLRHGARRWHDGGLAWDK